jgi:hypothetical protein
MKLIARDVELVVAGTDLSDHVQKISAPEKWPNLDVTGMGAKFVERLLGIGDFSVAVDFFQDYALGSVYATLAPLAGSNTPFGVSIVPVKTGGPSATNPRFYFLAVLDGNDLINGAAGAPSMISCTFWNADQSGVTVYTT